MLKRKRGSGRSGRLCATVAGVIAVNAAASYSRGASFLPGDLVVVQIGATGSSTPLANTGTAAFLEEIKPSGGAPVQTLALPTTASGVNQPLTISGTAGSEGELSLSANGQYLVLAGYDVGVGGTTQTTSTIGLINAAGVIDTSTTTTLLSGNNTRGAASSDGTQLWVTGPKGLASITADTTSGGSNIDSSENMDGLAVVPASVSPSGSNALYGSSGKSPHGIIQFASALPTSTTTATNLTGMSSTSSPAPFAFFFANPTTLFVADGSLGIQEWTSGGTSTWSEVATYNGSGGSFVGLTGVEVGSTVNLYATTGSGGWIADNDLLSIPFTFTSGTTGVGTFGSPVVLAVASGDSGFSGVAFAPTAAVPEPASFGLLALGAMGLFGRRRGRD